MKRLFATINNSMPCGIDNTHIAVRDCRGDVEFHIVHEDGVFGVVCNGHDLADVPVDIENLYGAVREAMSLASGYGEIHRVNVYGLAGALQLLKEHFAE